MNKKMILCGLMIFIVGIAIASTASANPIPVDFINIRYHINNLDNYNDYIFLLYGEGILWYQTINPSDDFFTYFSWKNNASIYLVKASDFNESEIGDTQEAIKNYFTNNSKVIKSNIQLYDGYTVGESDPLNGIQINLDIRSLTESSLTFQLEKIIYYYDDGSTTESNQLPIELNGRITITPESISSPPIQSTMQYWFIGTPVIAALSISFILAIRYRKRKMP